MFDSLSSWIIQFSNSYNDVELTICTYLVARGYDNFPD